MRLRSPSHRKMGWFVAVALAALVAQIAAVKVKVVMHSDEDSHVEEEDQWERRSISKRPDTTYMPFLKKSHVRVRTEEEEKTTTTTEKPRQMHPNEMIFPLIYRQSHINSMFKFGENWYTWSTEKRTDGSKGTNYYICYDEPKHCDEIGWERTDTLPKCAFQIDSLMPDDRACINPFGVEPHNSGPCDGAEQMKERTDTLPKCAFQIDSLMPDDRACINPFGVEPHNSGPCDGAEQMKVSDMVHACGPRIRSLWRFFRVGHRPAGAAKPADVNSLICEDEEECYITIEYRIHHDRITFSLHEPTRGQTFKSALKRETAEDEVKTTDRPRSTHRPHQREEEIKTPKFRVRPRKQIEGKGIQKERNDSGYTNRRTVKNKIKIREDVSEDISE